MISWQVKMWKLLIQQNSIFDLYTLKYNYLKSIWHEVLWLVYIVIGILNALLGKGALGFCEAKYVQQTRYCQQYLRLFSCLVVLFPKEEPVSAMLLTTQKGIDKEIKKENQSYYSF